jgi:hypothetical protein
MGIGAKGVGRSDRFFSSGVVGKKVLRWVLGRRAWEGEGGKPKSTGIEKSTMGGLLIFLSPVLSISITCMTESVAKEINCKYKYYKH